MSGCTYCGHTSCECEESIMQQMVQYGPLDHIPETWEESDAIKYNESYPEDDWSPGSY